MAQHVKDRVPYIACPYRMNMSKVDPLPTHCVMLAQCPHEAEPVAAGNIAHGSSHDLGQMVGTWTWTEQPGWCYVVSWPPWYVSRHRDYLQVTLTSVTDASSNMAVAKLRLQQGQTTLTNTAGLRAVLAKWEANSLVWIFPAGHTSTWMRKFTLARERIDEVATTALCATHNTRESPARHKRAVTVDTGIRVVHAGATKRASGRSLHRSRSKKSRHAGSLPPASRAK
jgi:hypothetical protein